MHSSASPATNADLSDAPSDLTFHPSRDSQHTSMPATPVSAAAHPLSLSPWEPDAPCSSLASGPLQQPAQQRQQHQWVHPAAPHTKAAQQAYIEQQQNLHGAVQNQRQQQGYETARRAISLPASRGFQLRGGTAGGLASLQTTQCSGPWPASALDMPRQLPPQLQGGVHSTRVLLTDQCCCCVATHRALFHSCRPAS